LKAGDELYTGVLAALVDREVGKAKRVDVSMLQAAASWLITTLPLLNFPHERAEVSRSGNQHRKFIPTDVFPTSNGYLYVAVGNDLQWKRLVEIPKFSSCSTPARFSNAGRHAEREAMFEDLRAVFKRYTTEEIALDLTRAKIPWANVNDVYAASKLPAIASKLTKTRMPDGRALQLQPLPVDLQEEPRELGFAPAYGEHSVAILEEAGFSVGEIEQLIKDGIAFDSAARTLG
jgi:crotonobetainyl-CoA:carnitine CoA-transferase CaiB-like acyl-CoA transferase